MANMKNAKKAIKTIKKKKESNNVEKSIVSKENDKAKKALAVAIKRIDKAASKGVVTSNFAARNKSRLTKKVNEMK